MKYFLSVLILGIGINFSTSADSLEVFSRNFFEAFKKGDFELLKEFVLQESDTMCVAPLSEVISQKELGVILKNEGLSSYKALVNTHEEILTSGFNLKSSKYITNVYENSIEKITLLIEAEDGYHRFFGFEVFKIKKSYKVVGRKIKFSTVFTDEVIDLFEEKGYSVRISQPLSSASKDIPNDTFTLKYEVLIQSIKGQNSKRMVTIKTLQKSNQTAPLASYDLSLLPDSIREYDNGAKEEFFFWNSGKLKSYSFILRDSVHLKKYYVNGGLKESYSIFDGKKEGLWTRFHYNGQFHSEVSMCNNEPVGIKVTYDLLGNIKSKKKYFTYDEVRSIDDLTYFLPYEDFYNWYTTTYTDYVFFCRKPSGWFVQRTDPQEETMLWRFSDQSFVTPNIELRSELQWFSPNDVYKLFGKPKSVFNNYDGWHTDVIRLLGPTANILADSLKISLLVAYRKDMKNQILAGELNNYEKRLIQWKELTKLTTFHTLSEKEDFIAKSYMELAFSAQWKGYTRLSNKLTSKIRFSQSTKKLVTHYVSECPKKSLLIIDDQDAARVLSQLKSSKIPQHINYILLQSPVYRNKVREMLGVETTIPETLYTNGFYINELRTKDTDSLSTSTWLSRIKDTLATDSSITLAQPVMLATTIENLGTYNLVSRHLQDERKIFLIDIVNAFLLKNPKQSVFFDSRYHLLGFQAFGFYLNKLIPADSVDLSSSWPPLLESAFNTSINTEIEGMTTHMKNNHASNLVQLARDYTYLKSEKTKRDHSYSEPFFKAKKVLTRYFELFGTSEYIKLDVRTDILHLAYELELFEAADQYFETTLAQLKKFEFGGLAEKEEFYSDMADFFAYGDFAERLKRFYPKKYKLYSKPSKILPAPEEVIETSD